MTRQYIIHHKAHKAEWSNADLALECINDEIDVHWVNTFDTLLHHVVAILIFNTLLNMSIQLLHNLHLTSINQQIQCPRHKINSIFTNFPITLQWKFYTM